MTAQDDAYNNYVYQTNLARSRGSEAQQQYSMFGGAMPQQQVLMNRDAWNAQNAPAAAGGAVGGGFDPATSRQKIADLTEGRGQDILKDPYQMAAMDFLKGVTTGQNVPYTDQVKNSILAQQGKGFASAEAAQMEAIRSAMAANGGSTSDPSFQAAQRQAMSQRQGQNLDAMGNLNIQSTLQNFNAQSQGANQLAAARGAQNAQVNQMNLAGAGYRAQDFQEQQRAAAPQQMPAPWFMQQMPQPQQAPAQQQQTAPRPVLSAQQSSTQWPAQTNLPQQQTAPRPTQPTYVGGMAPQQAPTPIPNASPSWMRPYIPPIGNFQTYSPAVQPKPPTYGSGSGPTPIGPNYNGY